MDDKLKKQLEDEGIKHICEIPNKGICGIRPFMFTVGLVTGLDEIGYSGRFCYPHENTMMAILALEKWKQSPPEIDEDPDDEYWIKSKGNKGEYSNHRNPSFNKKFDKQKQKL